MTEPRKVGTLGTLAKIAGHGLTPRNHRLGTLGTLGTPCFFHINSEQGKNPRAHAKEKHPCPACPACPTTLYNIIYIIILYIYRNKGFLFGHGGRHFGHAGSRFGHA